MSCVGHTSTTGWHCGACHLTFGSRWAFDSHRVGPVDRRRCLDPSELTAKGWTRSGRGWRTPTGSTTGASSAVLDTPASSGMGLQEPEGHGR